ncbi:MAG: hypothetical protein R3360_09725, partial [Alphaproteobacteria bacterium]|nr:hypothetical protein [Alphaproteobacteria bacterium]
MASLRDAIIKAVARSGGGAAGLTADSLDQHLRAEGHAPALGKLAAMQGGPRFIRKDASEDEVRRGLASLLLPIERQRLQGEIERVSQLISEVDDPRHFETLQYLKAELARLEQLEPED